MLSHHHVHLITISPMPISCEACVPVYVRIVIYVVKMVSQLPILYINMIVVSVPQSE